MRYKCAIFNHAVLLVEELLGVGLFFPVCFHLSQCPNRAVRSHCDVMLLGLECIGLAGAMPEDNRSIWKV